MNQVKLFLTATSLAICLSTCSQTNSSRNSTTLGVFKATTPCSESARKVLGIDASIPCEMMKWELTLYQDPKTFAPSTYKLTCTYGMPKQGTPGFEPGTETIESKGKWTIGKGTKEIPQAEIYTLHDENSSLSLSFLNLDPNLLHLLDEDKKLMVGSAAWSYTLNKVDGSKTSSAKFSSLSTTVNQVITDSPTVGVFEGRTPCTEALLTLNEISAAGCQRVKCQLTLYQDPATHIPTTFKLHTVYVGKGDTKYTNTGKWTMTRGTKNDPNAIVYQLQPEGASTPTISLLKAGDNLLFFLDKDKNLMLGNQDLSYTLNRAKK